VKWKRKSVKRGAIRNIRITIGTARKRFVTKDTALVCVLVVTDIVRERNDYNNHMVFVHRWIHLVSNR